MAWGWWGLVNPPPPYPLALYKSPDLLSTANQIPWRAAPPPKLDYGGSGFFLALLPFPPLLPPLLPPLSLSVPLTNLSPPAAVNGSAAIMFIYVLIGRQPLGERLDLLPAKRPRTVLAF